MSLSEAIEHLEGMIKENNFPCNECKKEHKQLLEWLIELKNFRYTYKKNKGSNAHEFKKL